MNDFAAKWLAEYERAEKRLDELTAGIADLQANFKPAPRKWSICQCLDHLANSIGTYLPWMLPAADKAAASGPKGTPPYARGTFAGWCILAEMRRDKRLMYVPAPRVFRPSRGEMKLAEQAGKLRALIVQLKSLITRTQDLELGRLRFRSPVSPLFRVSMAQAFEIHGLHLHRHLDQIERVKAHPRFTA